MTLRRLWIALGLGGCSIPNGEPWHQSIEDGVYEVSSVICASNDEPPRYRKPEQALVLYDFHELTGSRLVLQNPAAWRVFETANCQVSVSLEVSRNARHQFAFRTGRATKFSPETCTMAINFGDTLLSVQQDSSSYLNADSRSDRSPDIVFDVTPTDTGYRLESDSSEELHTLWELYGCGPSDSIAYSLYRIES